TATTCEPFRDAGIVSVVAFLRTMPSQVEILAAESDDCLPKCFMLAVGRNAARKTGHVQPPFHNAVCTALRFRVFRLHCAPRAGTKFSAEQYFGLSCGDRI